MHFLKPGKFLILGQKNVLIKNEVILVLKGPVHFLVPAFCPMFWDQRLLGG